MSNIKCSLSDKLIACFTTDSASATPVMMGIHRLATPLGMLDSGFRFGFSLAWFFACACLACLPACMFAYFIAYIAYTCFIYALYMPKYLLVTLYMPFE